jgi:4,5-dihydroxyphthalate decarboxylase
MLPDWRQIERDYYRDTGIFPIIHVMAVKSAAYEANPWIAIGLLKAFEEAKERSFKRLTNYSAGRISIPWGYALAEEAMADFGSDYYAYEVEDNRKTLETYLRYAYEPGGL